MKVASRRRVNSSEAQLTVFFYGEAFHLDEDSRRVDGIGGVVWEGALLTTHTLLRVLRGASNPASLHVLELGCGTGICGIVLASRVAAVTLTDQSVDLALANAKRIIQSRGTVNIAALPLPWGAGLEAELLADRVGPPHLIVGCEVACLRSQQTKLLETIKGLVFERSVVLMSFDELPPPNGCTAEREFDARMSLAGFRKENVAVARVSWSTAQGGVSDAVLEELPHPSGVCLGQGDGSCSPQELCEIVPVTPREERVEGAHHVVAYFKGSATVTCEFCGKPRFLFEE